MADDEYPIQQKLADLKKTLDSDPTNVESAIRYWSGLASFGGNDVRSGGFVIEAFRRCALTSDAGVVTLEDQSLDLECIGYPGPPKMTFDTACIPIGTVPGVI